MINYKTIYMLVLLIPFFACKPQDEPKTVTASGSIEIYEKDIDEAIVKLYEGIINRELSHLNQVASKNLSYGHSNGVVQSKTEFIDDVINGPFRFESISYGDNSTTISDNTAIIRHVFRADATKDGQPLTIRIGVMMVFQLDDGEWKLLARQAFKL